MVTTTYSWKLCIIGDGAVGKTSLVNRFVHNKFQDSYSETVGIDMFSHEVELKDHGVKISLLIYDLGGQDYWKSLRESFYQRSRGLILVYDVTRPESFDSLKQWHDEAIENIGEEVPTLVIGNKDDLERLVSEDAVKKSFIEEKNMNTYFTSAKTGEQVLTAFTDICNQIYDRFKTND